MKCLTKAIVSTVVGVAFLLIAGAPAQAAPLSMSIDNAVLDLGGLTGVRAIDPTLDPPDPPATLTGDLTGNDVNIPKEGFVFPTKTAEVQPGLPAEIDMEANEDLVGTFDAGSGELSIEVSLKATVAVFGATCVISPIQLELSTDNARPYLGEPFGSGIEGDGVLSAAWTGLPPVTGGGLCGTVAGLIAGPGGIAMSHGVYDFKTCESMPSDPRCEGDPVPTAAPKITAAPPATTSSDVASFSFSKGDGETVEPTGFECSLDGGAFAACNSGNKTYTGLTQGTHTFQVKAVTSGGAGPVADHKWTVNKGGPGEGSAKFGALKAKPKSKKVKRGKAVVITTKVKNVGDAAASGVKVCVKAPKKLVKVKKCVTRGNLPAGATATMKFKVKVKPKARKKANVKLTFKATGKGLAAKTARTTIRVG